MQDATNQNVTTCTTQVIVDCTDMYSETPSSVGAHKQFHSNYKRHSTVKVLVGMNTGGAITYICVLQGGRLSDKFKTVGADDLLSKLNPGEKNKKVSEARVHIERAIRRIKQFNILRQEVKLSQGVLGVLCVLGVGVEGMSSN
ncbi:hypothetical protein MAR_033433, partial [Mya arenaria]